MPISSSAIIHSTAIVSEKANIGDNVYIGPFSIVEDGVTIKSGTKLLSHVVVKGNTEIGYNNTIFQFVTIGEINQDLKYQGEDTRVVIGDNNQIRESVTIHRGTVQGGGTTVVGDDNLLMVNVHIAHDCQIGNGNVLANNVTLAGHVVVDDYSVLGGMTAVHQYVNIGSHVMIGGCSAVSQDVIPYILSQGNHAYAIGLNTVGLKRRGFTDFQLSQLKQAYRVIYSQHKTIDEACSELEQLAANTTCISLLVEFLRRSDVKRGIVRPRKH